MSERLKRTYKKLFLMGLILLFISLFLNWYYFQIENQSKIVIASWYYNVFFNWNTDLSSETNFNNSAKPNILLDTPVLNIMLLVIIITSGYVILFKDINSENNFQNLQKYSYINFFLISLNGVFIIIFPIYYLYSNNLYFPFLIFEDTNLNYSYFYSIGEGYILQIIGFFMIFPYTILYYQTVMKFQKIEHSAEKVIERYIDNSNDDLDLKELIAQEKVKIELNKKK